MDMFSVMYRGRRVIPSLAAMRELMQEEKALIDVADILEHGYDAPRKRKKGTIEKWMDKGKKTYNAVIVEDHHEILDEDVWVHIHFGKFTKHS